MAKCPMFGASFAYSSHSIYSSCHCYGLFKLWQVQESNRLLRFFVRPAYLMASFSRLQMNGDTIANAFKVQVLNYSIQTSLFDIIVVALLRFFFLWTFYGLFIVNHWSIIFVSIFIEILQGVNFPTFRYFVICIRFISFCLHLPSSPLLDHVAF